MKSAGIAFANKRVIVAILINSTVQIHRVKDVNEAKDILSVAKPDVVGIDISSSDIYEDIEYSFNAIKIARPSKEYSDKTIGKLTMLNITKEEDKPAIISAWLAIEKSSS